MLHILYKSKTLLDIGGILSFTLISGAFLTSIPISADDSVVDEASVTVPVSCSLIGTGMNTHNAEIPNGTYTADIGTTTLKAFCNDNEGFAIYATGYTGNEIGGTNSNKLVGTASSSNATIDTGTATSAGNPDTSNWAMKLTTVSSPTPTYPITLDNGFDSYSAVPNSYTKVAHRDSNTDIGTNAEGTTLTTTYAAYISKTQPADTYSGQVIYTLVHPAAINPNYLSVTYNGNGLYFDNTPSKTTNTMQYDATKETSSDPVTKTSRSVYNEDGTFGGYGDKGGNNVVTINGAEKIHLTVTYGAPENNGGPPSELYIWPGDHPTYTNANNSNSLTNCGTTNATDGAFKSNGQPGSQVTMECDINDNSVTFYDDSQYSVSTGYYAVITSIGDVTSYSKNLKYGTYSNPADNEGTTFLGWSTNPNATEPDYIDEADFIEKAKYVNNNGTITLYAIWQGGFDKTLSHTGKSQLNGYYKMQDVDANICNKVLIDSITTLIDERDNNTYMVRRLKDGRCWMLENLALDPTNSTTAGNMNESNTNASAEAIYNLLHGGSTTTGWSNIAVANITTDFKIDSLQQQPRINNVSKDTLVTSYGPASTNGQAKVGIYYNFCTASASTYCGDAVNIPNTLIDAPQDICPTNWRLPTGGDGDDVGTSEYEALIQKYSTDATNINSLQYNLSTPLSGQFYDTPPAQDQNNRGAWWSSTTPQTHGLVMHSLFITKTSASSTLSEDYDEGLTIRCLVSE